MKATGITAEYNPLHKGHVYNIEQAKAVTSCDAVVVAMSGDFVQRGEPAVLDKWTRTAHALNCGADLVVEIPVLYCLGNAGQYASAGVKLLEALGPVTHIAFGSESGNTEELISTADFLKSNRTELEDRIKTLAREGLSYPAARARAVEESGGCRAASDILTRPNDILAIEYIMAMEKAAPVAVQRMGAAYAQSVTPELEFQSATGIREMIRNGGAFDGYVPDCVAESLRTEGFAEALLESDIKLFDLVRFAVMSAEADEIDDCPSGGEGLGNLLKREVRTACSLDELISCVKSRRYTYTRISRLLMQLLTGISRKDHDGGPGYIRVLGFNDTGRALLSEVKNYQLSGLPIITNINKERGILDDSALRSLELDIHASDLFNLIRGNDIYRQSDYSTRAVVEI